MLPVAVQVPGWDATIFATGVSAPDLFNAAKARRTPAEQSAKPSTTRGIKKPDRELDFVFIRTIFFSWSFGFIAIAGPDVLKAQ
jgi:hypothetical protein